MELKLDFVERIEDCNWFENCGNQNFDRFEVVYMKDRQEAVERISAMKWERIRLAKEGELTVFLHKNYRDEYHMWNSEVQEVKTVYLGKIMKKVSLGLKEKDLLLDAVLNAVQSSIISLFMSDYYSEYYAKDLFYEHILELYSCGYLPCGWSGGLKDGKFKIY